MQMTQATAEAVLVPQVMVNTAALLLVVEGVLPSAPSSHLQAAKGLPSREAAAVASKAQSAQAEKPLLLAAAALMAGSYLPRLKDTEVVQDRARVVAREAAAPAAAMVVGQLVVVAAAMVV